MLNMTSSSQDGALQIKQNDKFFSRLLAKETSMPSPCPSFRVYYGGVSIAVPFMWESKPGTPKHPLSETSIPPLTPPPSYSCQSKTPIKRKGVTRSSFFNNLIPKILHRRSHSMSSSEISSSSSSSSTSSMSILMHSPSRNGWGDQKRCSTIGAILFDHGVEEEEMSSSSPTSTLCFGFKM